MKMFKTLILVMAILAVVCSAAVAAPYRLASITDSIMNPVRVAVDSQGNMYVTNDGKVVKYNNKWQMVSSFAVTEPLGVAVDAAGNIYVGSGTAVNIYSPAFTLIGTLGAGAGEFSKASDITVGTDGRIYVADTENHFIKVYDGTTRAKILSIGGYSSVVPTPAGKLRRPFGVAVNDATNEVYVVDYPTIVINLVNTDGARISVFHKDGVFDRSYGTFGSGVGQIASPMDIAIDNSGILYVTDSYQQVCHTLSPVDGTPVGAGGLYDPNMHLYNPMGVAVGKNGLAYIVSNRSTGGNGRVDIYALDGFVTMSTAPSALSFQATQYSTNPAAQDVTITNSGSGTVSWTASADQPWILLSKASGTVLPAGQAPSTDVLSVGADISNLIPGAYSGSVTIDSGFGQKDTISVTLSVVPAPTLVTNGTMNLSTTKGNSPAAQPVTISATNVISPLTWSASPNVAWLAISPASAVINPASPSSSAMMSVNATGMAVGSYSGVITITAPGALTSANITVNLRIDASSKITVTTNSADARFTVNSAGASYSGSGLAWSVENAPAGDYTVMFDAVSGFKRPVSQTMTLADGGQLAFSGNYVSYLDLAAKKNIVAAKGPDASNDSLVRVFNRNSGTLIAFDLVALASQYGANVAVGDIDGDGSAELVVGTGGGQGNAATVRVFRTDKTPVLEFTPFASQNGVQVAVADLNGDGKAEIIVASAGGADVGTVAVYTYDSATQAMVPTGISFAGFSNGTNVAVADTEGDGRPEIVVAPGFSKQNAGTVRIWKSDVSGSVGSWTAVMVKEMTLSDSYGATVSAGDVDNDGKDEIIIGTGGASGSKATISIMKADGTQVAKFKAFDKYGVNIAAADLDGDGSVEIVAAQGMDSGEQNTPGNTKLKGKSPVTGAAPDRGLVRVFSASGEQKFSFTAFDNASSQFGVNLAVGDLGL
ncbi:MAG: FG-GAP-like repeat-containing protein [Nitrospiraceae bacterium]|nr:FG-GAP-like repeat-containing protein [Nitrospiraceae bacterium]